jgi:predicted HTH domain antitoxin
MNVVLQVEVPESAFTTFQKTPEDFGREMRLAAAIKWYESGQISQEKAAELAGLSRKEFILSLAGFKTSPVQYSVEEIEMELA